MLRPLEPPAEAAATNDYKDEAVSASGINIKTGQGRFHDGRATVEYHKEGVFAS